MRTSATALVLALLAVPITTIDAQGLGRLVKKAKDKAAESAAKALEGGKKSADSSRTGVADSTRATPQPAAAAAPAAPATTTRAAAPARVDETPLAVDEASYALFLPVFKADAERRTVLLTYRKNIRAYQACKKEAMQRPGGGRSDPKAVAAAEARRDSIQKRWMAILDAEPGKRDLALADILKDSMDVAQEVAFQHQMPATLKCGTVPFPLQGHYIDGSPNGNDWPAPRPDPVLPAGMSWKQYGLLRERIGIWVASKGTAGAPLLNAAEVAFLKAHQAELMAYADHFSYDAMPHLTWGDVAMWR